jgi:L-fuculose-phosphate aldolase
MKKVISAKDIEQLIRDGADLSGLSAGNILTPSAQDILREHGRTGGKPIARASRSIAPPSKSSSPTNDYERILAAPENQPLKEQICEMGRRLWQRAYVDGNGGNMAIRIGENMALCTPTLVSKGSMEPEDVCLVDLDGNQLAGRKKRTSEILMHLQIMKAQPKAKATCHCHPPHATAFAVAGVEPPTCMLPEFEVFIGRAPIAEYRTPGTPEMGKLVSDLVDKHNTILMGNHGAVAWSHLGIEDAYFKMEILEAYCRTIVVASQLGKKLNTFTPNQMKDLLDLKKGLDVPDPRYDLKECELCDNSEWRPGVQCAVPPQSPSDSNGSSPDTEAVVQTITDEIMKRING